jgi:hypothetical protein
MKKSVPKTTSTPTATPKTGKLSARSRTAGLREDTEPVPKLTLSVRIRQHGKRGRPRKWDYDKVVSYVCEKISDGRLVSDVCAKIGIKVSRFWDIADSTDTYRALYARARKREAEQMKIYAAKVSEGRDWITLREKKRIDLFRRKNRKYLSTGQIASARENNILGRNRLQLDAAKWIAKVTDPEKFGDKQSLSVGGEVSGEPVSVTLRFVDAKGREITP